MRTAWRIVYGCYAWFVFLFCATGALLSVLLVPGLHRRRRWVSVCARQPFRLAGIKITIRGNDKLPAGSSVVVANHASYLDGVLLQAVLPPRFSFVIKGEMRSMPLIGFLLRRVGARFVERFDRAGSARDARRLLKAAGAGESLAVFPEGTFAPRPGLGPFRAGAFAAATRAGLPVVPLVISGSRHILPATRILPRHGHVDIDILDPIDSRHAACTDNRSLAALARQRILEVLDEPDLVSERPD